VLNTITLRCRCLFSSYCFGCSGGRSYWVFATGGIGGVSALGIGFGAHILTKLIDNREQVFNDRVQNLLIVRNYAAINVYQSFFSFF
jgi:hypothetical protein